MRYLFRKLIKISFMIDNKVTGSSFILINIDNIITWVDSEINEEFALSFLS